MSIEQKRIRNLELEVERLRGLLTECDGKLGRKPCQNGRCMKFVRMREALEWYEEQTRLARLIHSEGDKGRNALAADGGKKACAALAGDK